AAIGAAASAILSAMVPAEAERFAALAAEGTALRRLAGLEFPSDAEAGWKIGEAMAALALARAQHDGFSRGWTGVVPTGPGSWQGSAPLAPLGGTWRAWLLPGNTALRPPPPPAHDSPETAAALAELKAYPRTLKTNSDAVFWEVYGGARIYQFWNEQLGRLALAYRLGDEPARLAAAYAAMTMAFYDSFVACWDAKYAYWHIRPSQLDPTLTTVVSPPAHPSYPSAHSCLSTAAGTVLAALFPPDAPALLALARQTSEDGIAAGIHFRYDVDAGDEIGRKVAAMALAKLKPALQ
uniref:phosphatase PAP2 family protein n=1 Tax=Elioraea sp. TaxID=2185103 RepID=UPI003F71B7EF